jgi:hypothetical protein
LAIVIGSSNDEEHWLQIKWSLPIIRSWTLKRDCRGQGKLVPRGDGAEKFGKLELIPRLPTEDLKWSMQTFYCHIPAPTGK